MIIIIDSREQNPLEFTHEFISGTRTEALPVGDYQAEFECGERPPVIFERKGLGDLFGTLGTGYKRFKRELQKAESLGVRLIIIVEGTYSKVEGGYKLTKRSGVSIIRCLFTLWWKYGVVPVFCKDREEMAKYITEYYLAVGRNWKVGKK